MVTLIKKRNSFIVAFLIFFTLFSLFSNHLEAGECEDALFRCSVTALLIMVNDLVGGLVWQAFCFVGYSWCLEFME